MLSPIIEKVDELEHTEFSFAPEFISPSICSPGKNPEISIGGTTIFLKHYCSQEVTGSYLPKSKINLRNDCDSAILNLTLVAGKDRKEVFFLAELAPGKTVPLTFIKKDVYDIHFLITHTPITVHSSLKIAVRTSPTPGFKFNPTWFR